MPQTDMTGTSLELYERGLLDIDCARLSPKRKRQVMMIDE